MEKVYGVDKFLRFSCPMWWREIAWLFFYCLRVLDFFISKLYSVEIWENCRENWSKKKIFCIYFLTGSKFDTAKERQMFRINNFDIKSQKPEKYFETNQAMSHD